MRRLKLARFLMSIGQLLPWGFPLTSQDSLKAPLFVFGSGRNGSTLLNRMLNQHPHLFCPSEQYFLGPVIIKFLLYRHFMNWRDLVKVIACELDQSSGSHTWQTGHYPQLSALFESSDQSLQYLIDQIYRNYGYSQKPGFTFWVDTSAPNTRYCQEIFHCFPKAQYFFLLRDGRDVVNSYVKGGETHFGDLADSKNATRHWVDSLKAYDWLKRRTKVLLIRYEDLISKPETMLQEVCKRVDLEYHPSMLDFYKEELPEGFQDEYFQNVRKSVFESSIGLWKKELDPTVLQESLPIMQPYLNKFEYL